MVKRCEVVSPLLETPCALLSPLSFFSSSFFSSNLKHDLKKGGLGRRERESRHRQKNRINGIWIDRVEIGRMPWQEEYFSIFYPFR
jgi:hypothetical protein